MIGRSLEAILERTGGPKVGIRARPERRALSAGSPPCPQQPPSLPSGSPAPSSPPSSSPCSNCSGGLGGCCRVFVLGCLLAPALFTTACTRTGLAVMCHLGTHTQASRQCAPGECRSRPANWQACSQHAGRLGTSRARCWQRDDDDDLRTLLARLAALANDC